MQYREEETTIQVREELKADNYRGLAVVNAVTFERLY
jgi:hypothetical protein